VTRLPGSGGAIRILAVAMLVVATAFLGAWLALGGPLPAVVVIEALVLAVVVRSLFTGIFLAGPDVVVRGWARSFRYAPGELRAVTTVPYWRFLGTENPLLVVLRFTPESGWVREIGTTVAAGERGAAQAAAIRRHLGLSPT
jgi:hypothetical protein